MPAPVEVKRCLDAKRSRLEPKREEAAVLGIHSPPDLETAAIVAKSDPNLTDRSDCLVSVAPLAIRWRLGQSALRDDLSGHPIDRSHSRRG